MSFLRSCNLVFFFFISCQLIVSQDLSIEEYTSKDGLPSSKTYNIVQDSSGLIWIGTENGLVSFDGKTFTTYSHPELIDNDIIEVFINRNDRLYFMNLSEQVGYIENNKMVFVDIDGLFDRITHIAITKEKDYLVTVLNGEKIYFEFDQLENGDFEFKKTDIFYFNIDGDKIFSRISKYKFLSQSDSTVFTLKKENVHILYSEKDTYIFKDVRQQNILLPIDPFLYGYIRSELYQRSIRHNDNLFIIKNKGLLYYDQNAKTVHHFFDDLIINTIFIDFENNVWISTESQGLLMVSNLIQKINQKNSKFITPNGINDIYRDENGIIYLGTITSELIIYDSKTTSKIKISDDPKSVNIYSHKGSIYAYTYNSILRKEKNKSEYEIFNKVRFNHKALLFEDSIVYYGYKFGLLKKSYNSFFGVKDDSAMFPNFSVRVSSIYKDSLKNKIYIGTIKGLYTLKNDSIRYVKNDNLHSSNISKMTKGKNSSFWLGTRNEGVLQIRNDSIIKRYDTNNVLISNNINNLYQHDDELLVCTNSGLIIINLQNDDSKVINSFNFLSSDEVFACKVIEGDYWIGTIGGLTILTKEEINNIPTTRPKISLKNFLSNGVKIEYKPKMVLNYTANNIQLDLQNISYKSGKNKSVMYRIPFIDTTWITTTDPNLRLPSLRPGEYFIEAMGINLVGQQSVPLNIYFKIDIAWWNKVWVKLVGFLLLFGAVYSIILYRSRRIRKEEITKRNYLTQINNIKDQTLQLQMNPHFIFNSLNAIQGFIGTDDEELAMNYLARFARLIRLIFEHSKGNTITLEKEIEFIKLYLDLEKLRFKDKVNILLTIDPKLEKIEDVINVPPLLIQPIIENSFKHGLFHKKGKGNLKIDYFLENEILQVVIQDDGIGRVKSNEIAQKNKEKQTSSGIKTTIERIELLNFGKENRLNSVETEDLYDSEGKATGTKTTLCISI